MLKHLCVVAFACSVLILGRQCIAADAAAPTSQPTPMVQTCLDVAADFSPVYPTASFAPGVKEIFASVYLGKDPTIKKLNSTWVAVDVGQAAPPNYRMASTKLDVKQSERARLRYSLPRPMPAGKYRLEITGDGAPLCSADFVVEASALSPPELKQPQDLLPLTPGHCWTYDFVMESGPGITLNVPGTTRDAEGKLHSTVTLTVAGQDEQGTCIELRRNGELAAKNWWQLGSKGWATTQRQAGNDPPVSFDPPQVAIPWPIKAPASWVYQPKDHSYKQNYRIWGPVMLKGPDGDAPGYVVLCEQSHGAITTTDETDFLPGVGNVREIIVTAVNHEMSNRQTMTLTSVK